MSEETDRSDPKEPRDPRLAALGKVVIRCEEVFFTILLGLFILTGLLPIICRFLNLPGVPWATPVSQQPRLHEHRERLDGAAIGTHSDGFRPPRRD